MDKLTINFDLIESFEKLSEEHQKLISAAQETTATAYAPYSNFYVGASLLLEDNTIIKGSNQENMAYPSGLCAERSALFHYGSLGIKTKIKAIGIAATKNGTDFLPCSPCGGCRQVMVEYEMKQKSDIKVFFLTKENKIVCFQRAKDLLPFAFEF